MSLVKLTLTNITQPHIPMGIVQGYAQHQLGFGSRFAAGLANLFGGNNSLNSNIADKFIQLKQQALHNLEIHAKTQYPSCNCIAGVQFELLNLEINEGQDTILVCNVSGTAIEIRNNKTMNKKRKRSHGGRKNTCKKCHTKKKRKIATLKSKIV